MKRLLLKAKALQEKLIILLGLLLLSQTPLSFAQGQKRTPTLSSVSGTGTVTTYLHQEKSKILYLKFQRTDQTDLSVGQSLVTNISMAGDENLDRDFASLESFNQTQDLFAIFSPEELTPAVSIAGEAHRDILQSEVITRFRREQTERALRVSQRAYFYNSSTDTVAPIQPGELNHQYDKDTQKRMANEIRRYVLIKGIPKIIFSREDTKELGKAVDKTINAVQTTASISVQSKDKKWALNSGLNPLNGKTHLTLKNENWTLSATTNIRDNNPLLIAENKFGYKNKFTLAGVYVLKAARVAPSFSWALTNSTTTTVAASLPIRGENLRSTMTSEISLNHSF
jgi:hypothetical protein